MRMDGGSAARLVQISTRPAYPRRPKASSAFRLTVTPAPAASNATQAPPNPAPVSLHPYTPGCASTAATSSSSAAIAAAAAGRRNHARTSTRDGSPYRRCRSSCSRARREPGSSAARCRYRRAGSTACLDRTRSATGRRATASARVATGVGDAEGRPLQTSSCRSSSTAPGCHSSIEPVQMLWEERHAAVRHRKRRCRAVGIWWGRSRVDAGRLHHDGPLISHGIDGEIFSASSRRTRGRRWNRVHRLP